MNVVGAPVGDFVGALEGALLGAPVKVGKEVGGAEVGTGVGESVGPSVGVCLMTNVEIMISHMSTITTIQHAAYHHLDVCRFLHSIQREQKSIFIFL